VQVHVHDVTPSSSQWQRLVIHHPLDEDSPMKRVSLLLLGALLVSLTAFSARSDPPSPPQEKQAAIKQEQTIPGTTKQLSPLMRMKLDKSKEILEGLTVEDFDQIARNARSLKLLSMESGWNVLQTAEYANQSSDFRRTCELIEKAARDKDMGRAALGYVALTVRCVECHSYMRQQVAEPNTVTSK
jgi:hypothetical protein